MFIPQLIADEQTDQPCVRVRATKTGVEAMKKRLGIGLLLVLPALWLPVLAANTSQPPSPPMATAAQYAELSDC